MLRLRLGDTCVQKARLAQLGERRLAAETNRILRLSGSAITFIICVEHDGDAHATTTGWQRYIMTRTETHNLRHGEPRQRLLDVFYAVDYSEKLGDGYTDFTSLRKEGVTVSRRCYLGG